MIFQTEKQMSEMGDKIAADKKAPIEASLAKLKEAHKAQDIAGIDASMAELNAALQAVAQEMYSQQAEAQQQPNAGQQQGGDNDVTDVDFEEVK